jgi:hypothetical protein
MGSGSFTRNDWNTFSSSRKYNDASVKTEDIFTRATIDSSLDPKNFRVRESRDSADNPHSTPIILALDVTGSMSPVLDSIARKGMKVICEEIYNRKPVTNPQICSLGIGDVNCDQSPFQATQFESDIRISEELEKLYLEQGGGGNNSESYILAWYFAKYRTETDSWAKRGKKGFLFTIGDENITPQITQEQFKKYLNDNQMRTISAQELFDIVSLEWEIFHVVIKEGDHAQRYLKTVVDSWAKVIGLQHLIQLDDHTKLGEIIVSTIELAAGKNIDDIVKTWDGKTADIVVAALSNVATSNVNNRSIDQYL